jgi:CspA family cold shock protein
MKGTVKFFDNMKNFGFISGDDGKEYFVHITGIKNGAALSENDLVEFDVIEGDRGPKADNVVKVVAGQESESDEEDNSDEEEDMPEAA